MLGLILNEMKVNIVGSYKGGRVFTLLVFIAICILVVMVTGDEGFYLFVPFVIIMTTLLMSPKLNKIYYILPGEEKYRLIHIFIKSLISFLFNLLLYFTFLTIIVPISEYRYRDEFRRMFCQYLPFLITFTSLSMNTGYNIITGKNNPWMHANRYRYWFSMGLMVIPILFATSSADLFIKGSWFIGVTIASYLCTFIILGWQISICRHTDMSYENIKKVEKLFS